MNKKVCIVSGHEAHGGLQKLGVGQFPDGPLRSGIVPGVRCTSPEIRQIPPHVTTILLISYCTLVSTL